MWILVPLGNPGPDYAETRHNLGRLLLQRWMEDRNLNPPVVKKFASGKLYGLTPKLQALVPSTYMNLSGEVCFQAARAGMDPRKLILLYDDKDLPLGLGRFRLDGSDGGHNGLKSVFDELGTSKVARLRLGIGPFERPLADYVLGRWTDLQWEAIEALDAPFAKFLELLGSCGDPSKLGNLVNGEAFWGRKSLETEGNS